MRVLAVVFALGVLLTALVAVAGQNATSSYLPPSISIHISPVHDSVKVGDPIPINITLSNISDHDLTISREVHGHDFRMDVRDGDGKLAAETRLGCVWNGRVTNVDPARVAPTDLIGSSVDVALNVNVSKWWIELDAAKRYDMSHPGKYSITVQSPDPSYYTLLVKSNQITVIVTPSK